MKVFVASAPTDPACVGPPTMNFGQLQRRDLADARRYVYELTVAELVDRCGARFEAFRRGEIADEPEPDDAIEFPELARWRALGYPGLAELAAGDTRLLAHLFVFDEYELSHALSGWEPREWPVCWSVNSIDTVLVFGDRVRIEGLCYELRSVSPDPGCFVCTPASEAGVVCGPHRTMATLSSGERLDDFVARRADTTHPFEGSGLNTVLNPVHVGRVRCWADWHMAGPALRPEQRPCETWFDYVAQHTEGPARLLAALARQEAGRAFPRLMNAVMADPRLANVVSDLTGCWEVTVQARELLAERPGGWARSPEDAAHIAREAVRTAPEGDYVAAMAERLVALASG